MKWEIREHSGLGRSLFANNGIIEVGVPLSYGLRIGHFSFCGGDNVFFEQPSDMKELSTEAGWRVRGGHRLWIAPESEKVYYPDNEPICYEIIENGIEIRQKEDSWLHVKKSMEILFLGESELKVLHKIENTGKEKLYCSAWAISSMAPGGIEYIPLEIRDGGMDHLHRISMWDFTSLGDIRAEYTREQIKVTHLPINERYKIGIGHPCGSVKYENKGVTFVKSFPIRMDQKYPDGDVSYETYLCRHMVEIESLSPLKEILPGESIEHQEIWKLQR